MPGRVWVVGSANVDQRITMPRFPLPGETVAGSDATFEAGGKGANQAVAAARAGADTRFIGATGDDAQAALVVDALAAAGVRLDGLRRIEGATTGLAVVLVDGGGENTIVLVSGANERLRADDVERDLAKVGPGDAVVLQLEVDIRTVRAALRVARTAGAWTVLNAAPAPERVDGLLDDVDVLVVNETEAQRIVEAPSIEPAVLVPRLAAAGPPIVVVTLGGAGALLIGEGLATAIPAPAVPVVDTTAAGDTFVGYLAAELANGASTRAAVAVATAAGSRTVTRAGAIRSIPHRGELDLPSPE